MTTKVGRKLISRELDLNQDDVQAMTCQRREGVVERKPAARLESGGTRGNGVRS